MFQYLLLVPAATSLILGVVFIFLGEARPAVKVAGTLWFIGALYLQFVSSYPVVGLLAQVTLAMILAIWKKADALT